MAIGIGYNPYNNYNSYRNAGYGSYSAASSANASSVGRGLSGQEDLRDPRLPGQENPQDPRLSDQKESKDLRLPGQKDDAKTPAEKADPDKQKKAGRKSSPEDCETCKHRKYQDGSDEANVSFKSAAHVSPEAAGAAVCAHENEHVKNAYAKAAKGNGKVLSANVSIHTAICPECGRSYISGGTTNTMIKYTNEQNPYQKELKAQDATRLRGAHLDLIA